MLLRDKVALITGASTGIGAAAAKLFAAEGASVVLAARSEDKLKELVAETVVDPGVIDTPQTGPWLSIPGERERAATWSALKRLAQPEEVAEAAAWLLSDRASFVTGAELAPGVGLARIAHFQAS